MEAPEPTNCTELKIAIEEYRRDVINVLFFLYVPLLALLALAAWYVFENHPSTHANQCQSSQVEQNASHCEAARAAGEGCPGPAIVIELNRLPEQMVRKFSSAKENAANEKDDRAELIQSRYWHRPGKDAEQGAENDGNFVPFIHHHLSDDIQHFSFPKRHQQTITSYERAGPLQSPRRKA